MPGGDGTGPTGGGPGTGSGHQRRGGRKARMSGAGFGLGGDCVCPGCGHRLAHQAGTPCNQIKCPKCGTLMARSSLSICDL